MAKRTLTHNYSEFSCLLRLFRSLFSLASGTSAYHMQVIMRALACRTEVLPQGDTSDASEGDFSLCLPIATPEQLLKNLFAEKLVQLMNLVRITRFS